MSRRPDSLPAAPVHGVFARNLRLWAGGRLLLDGATFTVPQGRVTALVGRNGSGKSTLLSAILARARAGAPADGVQVEGDLWVGHGTRAAALPQSPQLDWTGTVAAYVDDHGGDPAAAFAAHEAALAAISQGAADAAAMERYGEALQAMDRLAAWDYAARRERVLAGLGLRAEQLDRAVQSLSGGEATRVALAAVLLAPAELLLLDEPTNHLDAAARRFLTEWLREVPAAVLLVSHDRDLLDEVDEILEVEEGSGHVRAFGGGFTQFEEQRRLEEEARLRQFGVQEERRARLEGAATALSDRAQRSQDLSQNDFYRARGSKVARAAKAQEARIERELRSLSRPHAPSRPRFPVPTPSHRSGLLVRAEGVVLPAGPPCDPLSWAIHGGQRAAVFGPSGCGKTTLLRVLAGEASPAGGTVTREPAAVLAHLPQTPPPPGPRESVLAYVQRHWPGPGEPLREALGKVLFADPSRLDATRVSDGELRRAACAGVFHTAPDLLLLDEPTNQLDLATIELLERALDEYTGAILAATHDGRFLRRLRPAGGLRSIEGRWESLCLDASPPTSL